jgi:hypothetical protein
MKKILLLSMMLSILLSGCHVISEAEGIVAKQSAPKIIPGVVTIVGTLLGTDEEPVSKMPVHFAQVFREKGKAAFLYDAGASPSAVTGKDGSFSMTDIQSGEYVMIIGDPMVSYEIIKDDSGEPVVIVAQGGETLDLGNVIIK